MNPSPAFRTPAALSEHFARTILEDFDTFQIGTGRDADLCPPADGALLRDPAATWSPCQEGFPAYVAGELVFVAVLGDGEGEFEHRERVVRARRKVDGVVIPVSPRFVGKFGVKECGEWVARVRYMP